MLEVEQSNSNDDGVAFPIPHHFMCALHKAAVWFLTMDLKEKLT